MKVKWTGRARSDVTAIYNHIAEGSEYYASEVANTILDSELRISQFPTAGHMVRERLRPDIREIKRYSYRIVYRILKRRIDVLTVVHERMLLKLEM